MNTVSLRKTRQVVFQQHRFLEKHLAPMVDQLKETSADHDKRLDTLEGGLRDTAAMSEPLRRPFFGRLMWLVTGR